jgi:hypothetical protein
MVVQHNAFGTEPHSGDVGDLNALQKQWHVELRYRPLVTTIDTGGWKLVDARISEFERIRSAHLLFTRGQQALSLFSIPGRATYWPEDGSRYEMTIDNHRIAGFVKGSSMYCIVSKAGEGEPTMKQLVEIVDHLERKMKA